MTNYDKSLGDMEEDLEDQVDQEDQEDQEDLGIQGDLIQLHPNSLSNLLQM